MTEIANNLKQLLRFGLGSNKSRETALEELRENYPFNRQRTIVEVALKDPSTKYDDIEEILSGAHYQRYLQENVKTEEAAKSVLNEFSDLEDFFKSDGVDKKEVPTEEEEDTSNKIPIVDTTGFEDRCFIDVDMSDVLEYRRTGDNFNGEMDQSIPSSKKAISALDALNQMSKVDQNDFLRSVNNAYDAAVQQKRHLVSKTRFVEELNKQLTYEERVRFINMLLKKSKDVLLNNK